MGIDQVKNRSGGSRPLVNASGVLVGPTEMWRRSDDLVGAGRRESSSSIAHMRLQALEECYGIQPVPGVLR